MPKANHALSVVRKFFPGVQEVVDADKPLIVSVTSQDVKSSSRKDHSRCALAQACSRELHPTGMIVSLSTAYVIRKNKATRYRLPERIRKEIVSFDRGAEFAIGDYELRENTKSGRLGHVTGGNKGGHGRTDKHIKRRATTSNVRISLRSKHAQS